MGSSIPSEVAVPGEPARTTRGEQPQDGPFVVVGVGASAGGLEALSVLLANLPRSTGMAFVVVQHLDPMHETMLSSLLSKFTAMPVLEVEQDLAVRKEHVHVIPRNTTMTIELGVFKLATRDRSLGLFLPIDLFLKSLAKDRQAAAIGVILSGTGSDGTLGMEEIKAQGGITFAQDASSAKYSGMPESAAQSGCVDLVLPPDKIAQELARIGQHPYRAMDKEIEEEAAGPTPDEDLQYRKILEVLRTTFRVDFSAYRDSTVRRRIKRRMLLRTTDNIAEYADQIRSDRAELDALYQDILINVTSFFREPESFEALKERIFPEILSSKNSDTPIRIWVPGCSTGQEAYSLAITLLEFLQGQPIRPPIQIFGTDLNESSSLVKARLGIYPDNIETEVSPERLRRFFTKEQATYRINKMVRDLCVFARQNVVADPPFSRMDLISCRNVLIYLTPALQKRVFPSFHFALNPTGFLFLGASETVGSFTNLFSVADSKSHVYVKKATALRQYPDFYGKDIHAREGIESEGSPLTNTKADWQRAADRTLLRAYAPAGVLVDDGLEILQFRGETGRYLAPAPGEPSHNLLKMAREDLSPELRDAINECRRTGEPVQRTGIQLRSQGEVGEVDIRVLPIDLPGRGDRCFLLLFEEPNHKSELDSRVANEVAETGGRPRWLPRWLRRPASGAVPSAAAGPPSASTERETDRLRRELAAIRDYLQYVIENQDAVNEELKSANEEILSSNEELRSTNEELETAKEELQSVNEELMTVNDQLNTRNLELTRISDDMTNLLGSARVPMVVVGVDLTIRKFTRAAATVLRLQPEDVGSPISHRKLNIEMPNLSSLIEEVTERCQTEEREVRGHDGHWYILRIHPYRTADHKIDGAVVVLADIDDAKQAQVRLKESAEYSRNIVETIREPLLILTSDLKVESVNRSFYEAFAVTPEQTLGHFIYDLGSGQWDIPPLRKLLDEILPGNQTIEAYEVEHEFPGIGRRVMLLNGRRMSPRDGAPPLILLAFQDVTERRRSEQALQQSTQRFRSLTESMPQIIFTARPDGVLDYFNQHWSKSTGLSSGSAENLSWKSFVHPEDLENTHRLWDRSIDTGDPFELEHRFLRSDGVWRWHLSRANALHDGAKVLMWTGSSTDIDDQKSAEVDLLRADERKNGFLAMLAHELRNPLAALECGLTLMITPRHEGDRDWAWTMSQHQVHLLTRMVDDLLDTSRITRGTLHLRKERVRPTEAIERAVATVQRLAEAQEHHLNLTMAPQLPQLDIDPARLEQVVCNLLTNAIKFTPRGGRIDVSAEAMGGDFVLKVRDSGIGIAEDFLERVFDPFTQVDTSLVRGRGGLGIGLSLVEAVVELHGGSVEVQSDGLGLGCTFVVRLPAVADEAGFGSESSSAEDQPALTQGGDSLRKRILMVDDNYDYALGIKRMLESEGHEFQICFDGSAALSQAMAFVPDVVLLDLGLPGLDGYEVARKMREDRSLDGTKLIVVSGYASDDDCRHSKAIGVDEHLAKPVRFHDLLRSVTGPRRGPGT